MAPKYVLVLWTKSRKISVVPDAAFVKSYNGDGEEIPLCEDAVRMVAIGEKQHEARILRICASKKYLETLVVTKDGDILLHGAKPPAQELLAKRSNLLVDETDEQSPEQGVLRALHGNTEKESPKSVARGSTDCSHGCPSCCSGTLPPFPTLPDGFVSTLVSLAEYFQSFEKVTENKVSHQPQVHNAMSKNLNTWQWASREKVELKKGTGVWIDSIKLEKILGQGEITKKPPHQTLVKSLLLDLLGLERYIETTAEKIDRRLISAVVGFVNEKYPDLAQPIERYYRCINLNRGYMLKRKNEGAFDNEEDNEGPSKSKRTERARNSRRQSGDDAHIESRTASKRVRRPGTGSIGREVPIENNVLNNFDNPDQLIIPLDYDNDQDIPTASSSNINKIIVVQQNNKSTTNPGNAQKSASQTMRQSTDGRGIASTTEVYEIPSDDDDDDDDDNGDYTSNVDEPRVKTEEDFGYIEGALDFDV